MEEQIDAGRLGERFDAGGGVDAAAKPAQHAAQLLGAAADGRGRRRELQTVLPRLVERFVAYLFTVYVLTKIIVSYWAGRFVLSRVEMKADSKLTHFGYLALGLLIFEALRATAIFGFVVPAVVMLFGLGCVLAYWVDGRRGAPVAAPKPIPAAGV